MKLPISGLFLLVCITSRLLAQAVDNTVSYRNVDRERYMRLTYENDYFSATDFYYTQGLHLELVTPGLRKFPLSKLLVHPKWEMTKWGLALEHDGYTPTSIQSDTILTGDRPFAAALFVKSFVVAVSPVKNARSSSSLILGVIGPAAGGAEMQTGIHYWINGINPHGWKYQVDNDLVLNYQVEYEKAIINPMPYFLVNGYAAARIGTLSDKASIGLTLMAGSFDNPFSISGGNKKLRIYIYDHPELSAIGYDATIEGGLFNKHSPYIVSSKDVKRTIFSNRFGAVLSYRRLYLEYWTAYISKEFSTAISHRTGGIQIGIGL